MGGFAQSILRAALFGVVLFGFSLATSAQLSLALESSLLGSEIFESSALNGDTQSIESKMAGKSARERANIKAAEIAKKAIPGSFTTGNIRIEIKGVEKIESGVQVFARAWRGEEPIGFGADGTVEIERFLIYNPPILVPDEEGPIVRTHEYEETGETKEIKYREDPQAALIETLAHTMRVVAQDGSKIIKGKRGNTTSTFFSDAGGDGAITTNTGTFANNRAGTGTFEGVNIAAASQNFYEDTNYAMRALYFPFDSSSIGGGETIASATFSVYGDAVGQNSPARGVGLLQSNQASSTTLTTADWVPASYTEIAPRKNIADLVTGAYNNYAVSNLSVIAKGSGFTKLMVLNGPIIDNDSVSGGWYFNFFTGDQTGTTQDPKLVVVHSSAATVPTNLLINGQTNPTDISGTTPEFSAVYNDPDSSDVATSYRIQVATSSGFTSTYWDSGKVILASSTSQGTRIADVIYGGATLASSTTYYWRIKFWDATDIEGAWSTETATFSLAATVPTKVRKSINESLANSTILQSDDQMRISLSANSTFIIDGVVFASSTSGTPDITIGFLVPSGAILSIGYTNDADQEVLIANATSSRIAIQANIPKSIHFKGTVKTSGSSGDVILQWAQATANAAATTVMQGSYMRADAI